MKIKPTRSARAFVALVPTLMLVSPAFAQDIPAQPPAQPPAQAAQPPAPVEQSVPAPVPAADPVFAPSTPVVQAVPDYTHATPQSAAPTTSDAPAATAASTARRTTSTAVRIAPARTASPAAPAAVPVAAAPVVTPAVENAPPAVAPEAAAPVAPTTEAAPAAATAQTTQTTVTIWPWIVGAGIVLLGLVALFVSRRRRAVAAHAYDEPAYREPVSVEPDPIVAPVAVASARQHAPQLLHPAPIAAEPIAAPAPVPAEETHIADADQADVDALTASRAPVADRPWIEFGMRPVRAGTTSDEALVEIELTVGNAGSVAAEDVRISTFLFASEPADADAFEKLLLEHGRDATADPVSIAAGEGTRVDATLALPKHDLASLFNPVVVADARYRLPDGSEGRTFASFAIGMKQEDGALGAMENNRPSMHEDVEARLYGTPEHV